MKILIIYKTEPSEDVKKIVEELKKRHKIIEFFLWKTKEEEYEILIDLIFKSDRVISFW